MFNDAAGTDCQLTESLPSLVEVFVVHQMAANVFGVDFSVPIPSCAGTITWLRIPLPIPQERLPDLPPLASE